MEKTCSATELFRCLHEPHTNTPVCNSKDFLKAVATAKKDAVARGDEVEAKELWKCETIAAVQSEFIAAFHMMKVGNFYDAWCTLERCEINLKFLMRHYAPDEEDTYWVSFISKMVPRWQSLFPYAIFFSPEFLKKKILCTICDVEVKPRSPCGHIVGEVYKGELCGHKIVDVEILGIAAVKNPVQKYSVAFTSSENGKGWVDHHNYSNVDYAVQRLLSPFHSWDTRVTTLNLPASLFQGVSPGTKCPCYSGESFSVCCFGKAEVTVPHRDFLFSMPPPENLPNFELCLEAETSAEPKDA